MESIQAPQRASLVSIQAPQSATLVSPGNTGYGFVGAENLHAAPGGVPIMLDDAATPMLNQFGY